MAEIDNIRIGDEIYVHGYVDEIRRDTMIVRNDGGYFGAVPEECVKAENGKPSVKAPERICNVKVEIEQEIDDWCAEHFNPPFSGNAFTTILGWVNRMHSAHLVENGNLALQLDAAEKSREHWQKVADRHDKERNALKAKLKTAKSAAKELGSMWPCFEDGALFKIGDEVAHYETGKAVKVHFMDCNSYGYALYQSDNFLAVDRRPYGTLVKRPPVLSKDGIVIEIGSKLRGEDGKEWTVTEFDWSSNYKVRAEDADGNVRELKPEWLTFDEPDSIDLVVRTLRQFGDGQVLQKGDMLALADRLERLAKDA